MATGLSPRLRGNPDPRLLHRPLEGSIPAPAGEPDVSFRQRLSSAVYPRACGGTFDGELPQSSVVGLSPRLRGNPVVPDYAPGAAGSIPAPAGEPTQTLPLVFPPGVYPRACGGTDADVFAEWVAVGLSPRLRGNRLLRGQSTTAQRSIPAPAGEPSYGVWEEPVGRVYPRACGGTSMIRRWRFSMRGLSPRLRGNLAGVLCEVLEEVGLSPRLRGNLRLSERRSERGGSIPAPAGEPMRRETEPHTRTVYPRACGGTCR